MQIRQETISFLLFVLMGAVFSMVFDFFRALRKIKKPKKNIVTIQDVIYFIIIGIILVIAIVNIKEEVFRLYLIIAIVLGITIYTLIVGNKIRNLFVFVINKMGGVLEFVFLPVKIQIMFWGDICKKIKKCVKLCCKKKSDMIEFYHEKVKIRKQKVNLQKKQKKEES